MTRDEQTSPSDDPHPDVDSTPEAPLTLRQVSRLLDIAEQMDADPAVDAAKLATAAGVSVRTVRRDLATLVRLGLRPGEDSGDTPLLPPLQLSVADALSITLLVNEVEAGRPVPGLHRLAEVRDKLIGALPESLRNGVRAGGQSIEWPPASQAERTAAFYPIFAAALQRRREVEVTYDSVYDGGQLATVLRPYHLLFQTRAWYVIAHSRLHGEVRTFHLGRVTTALATGRPYTIPTDFSVQSYFGNAWRMIRGERDYRVCVRFSPSVARSVADVQWHTTQRVTWSTDGSLLFEVTVSGLHEIAGWLLGYGAHAEVLQPPELRKEMRDRAEALSRIYAPVRSEAATPEGDLPSKTT